MKHDLVCRPCGWQHAMRSTSSVITIAKRRRETCPTPDKCCFDGAYTYTKEEWEARLATTGGAE